MRFTNNYIPSNPHTRIERYLDDIAGGVHSKPSFPETRIERYLDVISDGLVSDETVSTGSFSFRPTADNKSISTGYARIDKIYGRTFVYNQISKNTRETATVSGVEYTRNDDGTYTLNGTCTANTSFAVIMIGEDRPTVVGGHKYLMKGCPVGGSSTTYQLRFYVNASVTTTSFTGADNGSGIIATASSTADGMSICPAIRVYTDTEFAFMDFRPQLFDLTVMFGEGNEPTTVAEFERLFPNDYYPSAEKTLESVKPESIKAIGFNAFNGNFAKVIGGVDYYINGTYDSIGFETELGGNVTEITPVDNIFTPDRLGYIIVVEPSEDFCINISNPLKNGTYEPYTEYVTDINVRSVFPNGMKGVGDVRDEIDFTTRKAITRIGVRDYEEGDDIDVNVMTDGVITYYELDEEITRNIGDNINNVFKENYFGTEEFTQWGFFDVPFETAITYIRTIYDEVRDMNPNFLDTGGIDGEGSLDNLLTALGTACGGTFTKAYNFTDKKWEFTFTAN